MNRQQRRAEQRLNASQERNAQKKAALQYKRDMKSKGIINAERALEDPHYMSQVVAAEVQRRKRMEQNGITEADLKAEFEKGYKSGRYDACTYWQDFFYSAIMIALKRRYKFGETRLLRALEDIQQIMTEEITTCDIVERCRRETGLDIRSATSDEF